MRTDDRRWIIHVLSRNSADSKLAGNKLAVSEFGMIDSGRKMGAGK